MFEYDAALKILLKGSAEMTIQALSGLHVKRWFDVELPRVEEPRVDMLGEADDGRLLHIELQSSNDPAMPLRMLDYGVRVTRQYMQFPKQVLLYVGTAPLTMPSEYRPNDDVLCRYRCVDFREIDGERLLASRGIGDNVIAILAHLGNQREAIRHIVGRIGALDKLSRGAAMEQLMILAGLRRLAPTVEEEAKRMPITENILDHEVLGREYKKGMQQGMHEGEAKLLRRQVSKRFGNVPQWLDELLSSPTTDLESLSDRVLDAKTLDELKP